MSSHTKKIAGCLALAVLAALLSREGMSGIFDIAAHAQQQTSNVSMYTTTAQVLALGITFMQFLMHIIIHLLAALIDPEFILGTNTNGEDILLKLWQFSRDIMNVIFAVMLVGAAMYWVVTASGEKVKPLLPKFIVGIVLVNFSWFFPRVIMDVANVTAATVYQIPSLMSPGGQPQCFIRHDQCNQIGQPPVRDQNPEPCQYIEDVQFFNGATLAMKPPFVGYEEVIPNVLAVRMATLQSADLRTPSGVFYGLVYNMGRLGEINRIMPAPNNPGAPQNLSDILRDLLFFIIDTMFVFSIHTMLFFPLLAMISAFVMRIIVLWLTIAFMPFMFIGFVTGGNAPGIPVNTMDIFNHYVKAAFLPAVVGLPISVGFILINAAMTMEPPAGFAKYNQCSGTLLQGVGTVWHILFLLVTYFIIWKGFFFTLEKYDSIYANAAAWAKSVGGSIGGVITKAPLVTPFIPTPGGPISAAQAINKINPIPANRDMRNKLLGLNQGAGGGNSQDKARAIESNPQVHRDLEKILLTLRNQLRTARSAGEKDTIKNSIGSNTEVQRLGVNINNYDELLEVSRAMKDRKFDDMAHEIETADRAPPPTP